MSRKIIVGLVVLALVLAAGFGVYYVLNNQSQAVNQRERINASSEEPLVKLVYVSTGETLSEALYHLDLQDGKLAEPHIVHHFINDNRHTVKFIDMNNKAKKELKLEDASSKIDVYITKNGRYAMVQSDFNERDFSRTTQYYDIDGILLWEKKNSSTYYYMSPNGELMLEAPGWDYQIIHLTREYALLNSKGDLVKKFKVGMGGVNFGEPLIVFSNNSKYLLMVFNVDYLGSGKNKLLLLDEKGDKLIDKNVNGVSVNIYATRPLNNGNLLLDTFKDGAKRMAVTKIFEKNGKELYSKTEQTPAFVDVSPNNKIVVSGTITNKGNVDIAYLNLSSPNEILAQKSIDLSGNESGAFIVKNNKDILFSEYKKLDDGCFDQEFYILKNSDQKIFFVRKGQKEYLGISIYKNYLFISANFSLPGEQSFKGKELFIFKTD